MIKSDLILDQFNFIDDNTASSESELQTNWYLGRIYILYILYIVYYTYTERKYLLVARNSKFYQSL